MATWNTDNPDLANQISADVPDIEENLQELHDVITAITNSTLGTTAPANFKVDVVADESIDSDAYVDGSIDNAHLSADCVDDTKIGDAKVKKEHINADVAGTGLTGGAGTALSVDGIEDAGGTELKVKVIEIGDWNMDSTSSVNVTHGLTITDVRNVDVVIRANNGDIYSIRGDGADGYWRSSTASYIYLVRTASGLFDSANFNSTSYNRGWVTIWYVA